jgi:purine-nucleoside phosphorylase
VARHARVPVFGMSVITDVAHATEDDDYVTDGNVIVAAANAAADRMTVIFRRLVEGL